MLSPSLYIELHCHSNLSLLDGASSPEQLIQHAAALGMDTLALTDHDALYSAVRFHQSASEHGICPIFGAELTLEGGHHLTLLVENETGWQNLCWLISEAQHNAPKGSAALPLHVFEGHTQGLIALSGCRQGAVATALLRKDNQTAFREAAFLYDQFGRDHFWIELQRHHLPDDAALTYQLVTLARHLNVGYVATNNVHYATRDGQRLQDVLVCIRHGRTLDEAGTLCRPNSEYYLKSGAEMQTLFADLPAAITNTRRIAQRCQFSLRYSLQDLPIFPKPNGVTDATYLRQLCQEGLPQRLPTPSTRALAQLDHELHLIERRGLANYFLVVWDLVRYAQEQGIRCQGRGSAANSLVAYLLGISPINPLAHDLVFERFLSEEHRDMPDIDIDFQADRREEIIQYLYQHYGHTHVAMACTLVTFRERSAIREVGKVLGLPPDLIAQHTAQQDKKITTHTDSAASRPLTSSIWQQFDDLCRQIRGFPRHLGIHNGGMVIMRSPLSQRVPTEPAAMAGRVVIQWDKESLEQAGLIKIDVLGLRMLSVIAEVIQFYEQTTGSPLYLDRLTFDDAAIYNMITEADTIGVFQVESRAQAQVLPRLQPRRFEDLIVAISLIRPGPIQGQMVHPYLRRRLGEEPIRYLHPRLEPVLAETLGVVLFQEQILKVAEVTGQLTRGQGELLRRALGKGDEGGIAPLQALFLQGAANYGVSSAVAAAIFGQMRAFGGYSFPKSHAAAFAVLVYQSAWLKRYCPAMFFLALLNNQPMGYWSPSVLVNDARHHGIRVLTVDIHHSEARCTLEDGAIRLGFLYVRGLGQARAELLIEARKAGSFSDLADFCRRVPLSRHLIENLIRIGAMDSWSLSRRQLLWNLNSVHDTLNPLGLRFAEEKIELPSLSEADMRYTEYELLGLSPDAHIMQLYQPLLAKRGYLDSQSLLSQPQNTQVKVAGQMVIHQAPPSAKGMHFISIEDFWGLINIVVRPDIYEAYRVILRTAPLLLVEGVVQRKGDIVNVRAQRFAPLLAEHNSK